MNNKQITEALIILGYNTGWVVRGDTYEGIEWIEQPKTIPTKKDIENAIILVQAEIAVKAAQKAALLERLGITEAEAKLLLG